MGKPRIVVCVTFFLFIDLMDVSSLFTPANDTQSALKPGAAATAILKSGEIIKARVAQILAKGLMQLDLGSAKIVVKTQLPLKPGQHLTLQVEQSKGDVKLVILDNTNAKSAKLVIQIPQNAAVRSATGVRDMQQNLKTDLQAQTRSAPVQNRASQQISNPAQGQTPNAAVQNRAAQQNSNPSQGQTLNAAAQNRASQQIPNPSQGQTLTAAAQNRASQQISGPLQAPKSIRTESPPPVTPQLSADSKPVVQSRVQILQAVVSKAVQSAISNQNSLNGIFSEAKLLVQSGTRPLPAPVQTALKELLGLRLPVGANISAKEIRQAFSRSGLFLENRLAGKAPDGQSVPADLKSVLLKLQGALRDWIGEKARPLPPPENRYQPPFRQNLPQGQPPRPPVLESGSALHEAGRVLLGEARAALSRLTLLQTASMPAQSHSGAQRVMPEWNFEIPLQLGEETAIAQFRIDSEDHGDKADRQRRWSVHVSLDVPETGPVHASIGLSGKTVRIGLWAERDETLAMFKSRKGELIKAFEENGLKAENITLRKGAPKARVLKPGSMMDQVR